jgi:predicted DNA-binding protein (UPF0251 family)
MVRPRKPRLLRYRPKIFYFKPRGIPLKNLEEIVLFPDEWETLKLCDAEGLKQQEAAKRMNVSQPTLQRTLSSAHKKIADALVLGKAIRIERREPSS